MFLRSIIFCSLWFTPVLCLAESSAVAVTFDEVLEHVLKTSIPALEIEARIVGKKSEGVALSTLSNPELDSEFSYPADYEQERGKNEVSVSVSQALRASNFGLRQRINTLISESADTDRAFELLQLTQAVRLLYGKAWIFQERSSQVDESLSRSRDLGQFVKKGIEQGLFGVAESSLFTSETAVLEAEKLGLQADLDRAKSELLRKSSLSLRGRRLAPLALPPIERSAVFGNSEALPIAKRIDLLGRLANEQYRLSRLDSFPAFAPRILYNRNEEGTDYVGIGLSIELPFFDRNQAEKMKRNAELNSAKATERYFQGSEFNEELELLLSSALLSSKQVSAYEQRVIPSLRESLSASEKQLRAGQGSVLQVWQVRSQLNEAQSRRLELWLKALSERSELSALVGRDL